MCISRAWEILERTFLHLRVAPGKVVKSLGAGFGSVHREGQVVVLEVETDTREIDDGLDAGAAELVRVTWTFFQFGGLSDFESGGCDTNSGPLQDQRGRHRAAGHDNLLASTEDTDPPILRVMSMDA